MKRNLILVYLFLMSTVTVSCSHYSLSSKQKISLNLVGEVGHKDDYDVFSQTLVENFKDDQLINQKMDIVDFDVMNEITSIDSNKNVHVLAETLRKDGSIQLHDMAYPELHEKIELVFNSFGQVLKAGKYSKDSLFFVPPLPLPQKEIQEGDAWKYEGEWKSSSLQGPMKLKLQLKLKKIIPCFDGEKCAGVEWTGSVEPVHVTLKLPIASSIKGYAMYRPKTGSQLWTYTRNVESFKIQNLTLQVSSCVQSILKSDKSGMNPFIKKDPVCDPSRDELDYFENPQE